MMQSNGSIPLCVDMDGTLIQGDALMRATKDLIKQTPFIIFQLIFWIIKGRAYAKRKIAHQTTIDLSSISYNEPFLDWLKLEKQRGRVLYLVTASDELIAKQVVHHLNLFSEIIGSNGTLNRAGSGKARALVEKFGEKKFDYAGNSRADIPAWAAAKHAIIAYAPRSVLRRVAQTTPIIRIFA